VSAITSILVCAMKSVNPFARRRHLFDIVSTLIDVDANILSYSAPFSMFYLRPKCSCVICPR